jgi:hypothetical protein
MGGGWGVGRQALGLEKKRGMRGAPPAYPVLYRDTVSCKTEKVALFGKVTIKQTIQLNVTLGAKLRAALARCAATAAKTQSWASWLTMIVCSRAC